MQRRREMQSRICRVYLLLMRPALAPASDAPVIEGTPFNWISNDRIVSVAFAIARGRRDVFRQRSRNRCTHPIQCTISFFWSKNRKTRNFSIIANKKGGVLMIKKNWRKIMTIRKSKYFVINLENWTNNCGVLLCSEQFNIKKIKKTIEHFFLIFKLIPDFRN